MIDRQFALAGRRVWVAGHRGMVGSAICRRLATEDCTVLTATRDEVDLTRQAAVEDWMERERPKAVFVAAAKVGGIRANDSSPAQFIYENLVIQTNIIHTAWKTGVDKLVFLGSSCIYPKLAPQPIPERSLLEGPLEPTNQWYAVAKIAGIKMCQAYRRQYGCDFVSAMPTNLYGPGDNFDQRTGHVVPALMARAHRSKVTRAPSMEVWGTGTVRREFLYSEDLADAVVFLMKHHSGEEHINVGTGDDVTIVELAKTICDVVGYDGDLRFNPSKPDGTPRKLLDVSRIHAMGWAASTGLRQGLERAYAWFLEHGPTQTSP